MLRWLRIKGNSMIPAIQPGAYVLLGPCWRPMPDALVCVRHPHYGDLVKRLRHYDAQGRFCLAGENTASVTSEQMGWLPRSALLGRVWLVIQPDNRHSSK